MGGSGVFKAWCTRQCHDNTQGYLYRQLYGSSPKCIQQIVVTYKKLSTTWNRLVQPVTTHKSSTLLKIPDMDIISVITTPYTLWNLRTCVLTGI